MGTVDYSLVRRFVYAQRLNGGGDASRLKRKDVDELLRLVDSRRRRAPQRKLRG